MIIGNPDIEKIKIKDSLIPMQISMQEYEENKNNKSFNIVQSAVKFYEMDHEVTIVRDTKNETPKIYDLDEVYASKQDKCPLSQKYLINLNDKQKIGLQCGHIFDIFSLQSQQLSALQKEKFDMGSIHRPQDLTCDKTSTYNMLFKFCPVCMQPINEKVIRVVLNYKK